MGIYKVNPDLPPSTKIEQVNDMVFELDGKFYKSVVNLEEINALYSGTGLSRKFKRQIALGHNITGSGIWSDWTHWKAESGYSMWSIEVSNFEDNIDNTLFLDNIALTYMGEASSLSTTDAFNKVYTYNDGTYTDRTTEASSETGVPFALIWTLNDYLYLGNTTKFNKVQFVFNAVVTDYDLVTEYWHGGESQWKTLVTNANSLIDTTEDFISNGRITYDTPDGWSTNIINGVTDYWLRFSSSTVPATGAALGTTAYQITKADTVSGLLQLSNDEILNADWKWCYYETASGTGSAYATIRNDGQSSYEGNYYIESSSSDANKQNYFVYNHAYKIDYVDSSYDESTALTFLYDFTDDRGEVVTNMPVMFTGSGIHPATALTEGWHASAICKSTEGSGSGAKVQTFGKITGLRTESKDNILNGHRLYLSTGSGMVTKDAPPDSGQIIQLIGSAVGNESSGTVVALLHINLNYSVN